MLSIGMLTALTISALTVADNSVFAKKKHCEKSHKGCDIAKVESKQTAQNITSENATQSGPDNSLSEMTNSPMFSSQFDTPY